MNSVETVESVRPQWQGGTSPFGTERGKLTMWLFIVTDALLFAGFLTGYGFARLASPTWPDRAEVFNLGFIALMTFILISSSATMASAVVASKQGDRRKTSIWLLLTIVGGIAFLGCQAYEWSSLIAEGASLSSNPWGVPIFSAVFFLVTGFHGTHVLSGIILNIVTAVRWSKGTTSDETVEVSGLYWHFIDLVWVFIFTLFYLI
jgi:cytochrome c oxidase subunit 3